MGKCMKPDDARIGANVRRIRQVREMSQEKLGGKLGLTFQQVQKYESGKNRIGGSRLAEIANILQVPVIELFNGVSGNGEDAADYTQEFFGIKGAVEFARAIMDAPPKFRAPLVRACTAVVNITMGAAE